MPKLRYAIAALFFAASVGCLALWSHSVDHWEIVNGPIYVPQGQFLNLQAFSGTALVMLLSEQTGKRVGPEWKHTAMGRPETRHDTIPELIESRGHFGTIGRAFYFPLWYASLVFALAGVGVLRFRRQFSIRSALVGLTVVAALLGMVVAL